MDSQSNRPCNSVTPERQSIFGTLLSVTTIPRTLETITCWIETAQSQFVVVCPVYNVMYGYENEAYQRLVNDAGMVTPDGMPLVILLRWLGYDEVDRTYGPDLLLAFAEQSQETGYSSFFYGGADGIPERLVDALQAQFPDMPVAGTYSPPFRKLTEQEIDGIIDLINAANPDVVWVGLGSPKQDLWMQSMRERLNAPVLIGVGAAFDFLSGEKPQAPKWMQRAALEWLFRLLTEPRRLWRRYLIYNTKFILRLLHHMPQLLHERASIRS